MRQRRLAMAGTEDVEVSDVADPDQERQRDDQGDLDRYPAWTWTCTSVLGPIRSGCARHEAMVVEKWFRGDELRSG